MHAMFVVVLLLCSTAAFAADFDQTVARLSPTALRTTTGRHSPQPLAVLSVQDQAGRANDWERYKELFTAAGGYAGVCTFVLPTEINPSTLTALALQTNYRGPARREQRWLWSLYDFAQHQWVRLGDNGGALNWVWTPFTF